MKMVKIESILEKIRNKYASIRQITETLNIDSKTETCRKVLEQRSGLLTEITAEQNSLEHACPEWRKCCTVNSKPAKIISEIQSLIATAVALDSAIQDKFRRKIEEVQMEIGSLSKTSKAALSYARHNSRYS